MAIFKTTEIAIPQEVKFIIEQLSNNGYQAYIVGGCVRDLLREARPNDWDVATNAKPEEIQKIFPKSFYSNKFFTVTVLTKSQDPLLKEIEVTTYRKEAKYTDKRHPDKVEFAKTIKEDLSRRDFTINAMAIEVENEKRKTKNKKRKTKEEIQEFKLIDPFDGQKDLGKKLIRAVGKPEERFKEDALRLMRAVRFATVLGFQIEKNTLEAIRKNAGLLEFISKERIRDEFMKIIMSERAMGGIELLRKLKLLHYIIPELEEAYGVTQNKHHIYDVYEHSLRSLDYAAKKGFNKYVRIAALLHDIGKPATKQGEGPDSTFYNHEIVGAKMTAEILQRLRFSKRDIEKIVKLVRYHLFYYNVGEVGEASVRRLLRRVGKENLNELVQLRMCDRIGSGCPKALPYKLRHFLYVAEKVSQDPIDVSRLKINGSDIMAILNINPGPKIGKILKILLAEVLEKPELNNEDYLKLRVKNLGKLPNQGLDKLANLSKEKVDQIVEKRDEMTKKKYWVS